MLGNTYSSINRCKQILQNGIARHTVFLDFLDLPEEVDKGQPATRLKGNIEWVAVI